MKHLKTIIKEREIIPNDILNRIREPKNPQVPKDKRAKVILQRTIKNKTFRQLAKDEDLSQQTINNILKKNKKLIEQIRADKTSLELEQEERVIVRLLSLLEKKVTNLENSQLTDTKLTEITRALMDIFQKIQLQKGEPTTITKRYESKDLPKLKQELIRATKCIKSDDSVAMLEYITTTTDKNKE